MDRGAIRVGEHVGWEDQWGALTWLRMASAGELGPVGEVGGERKVADGTIEGRNLEGRTTSVSTGGGGHQNDAMMYKTKSYPPGA